MTPPSLPHVNGRTHWDDLSSEQQADVLAYDQVSYHDENEFDGPLPGLPGVSRRRKGAT